MPRGPVLARSGGLDGAMGGGGGCWGRNHAEQTALCQPQLHKSHREQEAAAAAAKSLQLCPTLCDPIDGSPSGSVPGILQARTLEWVAIYFPVYESEK